VEALRESEERYRSLVENSKDSIIIIDMKGNILFGNKATQKLTGYTLEEGRKMNVKDITPLRYWPRSLQMLLKARTGKPIPYFESVIRRKDGSLVRVESGGQAIIRDGKVVGVQVITRDITERIELEAQLRKEEERWQTYVREAADLILTTDATGKITSTNRAVCQTIGYAAEDLLGKNALQLVSPENHSVVKTMLRKMLKGEGVHRIEFEALTRDGRRIPLEIRGRALYDGNRIVGTLQIARDITERKRMEEQLRLQSEIAENIFEGVLLTRAGDGAILYTNPRFAEMFGYEPTELVGQNMAKLNAPVEGKGPEDVAEEISAGLKKHGMWSGEVKNVRKDGTFFWCRTNISTLASPEHGTVWVGTNEDITERKRIQEKLSALHKHALQLNAASSLEEIAKGTLDAMEFTLGFDHADFCTVVDGSIRIQDSRGMPLTSAQLPGEGPSVIAKAVKIKSTLRIPDTRKEPDFLDNPATGSRGEVLHMLSELAAPAIVERDTVAVLNVENTRIDAFTETDQMLLETLAMHVASAISRLRKEEALRSSEARYRAVVEDQTELICRYSPDGVLTFVNDAYCRYFGKKREELIGREFIPMLPEGAQRVASESKSISPSHPTVTYDQRVVAPDGQTRWQQWTDRGIFDEHGRTVEFQSVGRDVTEGKRMQEELERYSHQLEQLVAERTGALQESEKKYRLLIEAAQEGLFTYDKSAVVTFVNPFLSIMLGYAPQEMVGKNLLTFVDDQDLSRVKAGVERRRRGIADTYEVRLTRKDGSLIYTNATVSPIMDENGKFAGGLALLSDITERKKLEAQLAESQRLAAIGETTTMVGHDLRNPLQAMTGTLYLVKKLVMSDKAEERKKAVRLLSALDDEIQYMNKVVSDLQDYARQVRADVVQTSLPDIIRETVSNVKVPRNVEVTVSIQRGLSNVLIDPVLLRRVLSNLILNAVQAMPKGGKLTIIGSKEGEFLIVAVQDTGVGIAPENLGKIFTPFFTTKSKGQGLGLPVCKRLIEAHGGSINLATEVGKGSTFTVAVPTNRAQVET
jgi:PAS domain S-box-containing protein